MINKSHKVLDGKLREIRRSFGRNAVALRCTGGEEVLRDEALIAGVKGDDEEVEVLLAPGANAQELLQRLVGAGAQLTKFELVEPTLHDIFIEKVREVA
jgi:ABC-2 type transport system ATP-binding protein